MASDERMIAARYTQALFELAQEAGAHAAVKADLQTLKTGLKNSDAFTRLLEAQSTGRARAAEAMESVLGALNACELTRKFFALLARNRRLGLTALVIDAYLARLSDAQGELGVKVVSAKSLSTEDKRALSAAIATATGKKVEMEVRENPDLIGGVQIRIGSTLLDMSVATKLNRLRRTLTNAA